MEVSPGGRGRQGWKSTLAPKRWRVVDRNGRVDRAEWPCFERGRDQARQIEPAMGDRQRCESRVVAPIGTLGIIGIDRPVGVARVGLAFRPIEARADLAGEERAGDRRHPDGLLRDARQVCRPRQEGAKEPRQVRSGFGRGEQGHHARFGRRGHPPSVMLLHNTIAVFGRARGIPIFSGRSPAGARITGAGRPSFPRDGHSLGHPGESCVRTDPGLRSYLKEGERSPQIVSKVGDAGNWLCLEISPSLGASRRRAGGPSDRERPPPMAPTRAPTGDRRAFFCTGGRVTMIDVAPRASRPNSPARMAVRLAESLRTLATH